MQLSKKVYYAIGVIFSLLILFFLLRGCSSSYSNLPYYRIGRNKDWSSVSLMGKEKNILAFSDALLTQIAAQENLQLSLSLNSPDQLLTRLENGELDGILSELQPDVLTEKTLIFSKPYLLFGSVLVVPINSELDQWEELQYKIIGIMSQSPLTLELTKEKTIRLKLYEDILKSLSDLYEQHIDGVILPAIPAYIYTRTFYPGQLKVATGPLTNEGLRLVTLKNDRGQDLIDCFNKGLDDLKATSTYDKLINNWGLINIEKSH